MFEAIASAKPDRALARKPKMAEGAASPPIPTGLGSFRNTPNIAVFYTRQDAVVVAKSRNCNVSGKAGEVDRL
jgi:hypothetical protein